VINRPVSNGLTHSQLIHCNDSGGSRGADALSGNDSGQVVKCLLLHTRSSVGKSII